MGPVVLDVGVTTRSPQTEGRKGGGHFAGRLVRVTVICLAAAFSTSGCGSKPSRANFHADYAYAWVFGEPAHPGMKTALEFATGYDDSDQPLTILSAHAVGVTGSYRALPSFALKGPDRRYVPLEEHKTYPPPHVRNPHWLPYTIARKDGRVEVVLGFAFPSRRSNVVLHGVAVDYESGGHKHEMLFPVGVRFCLLPFKKACPSPSVASVVKSTSPPHAPT